MIEESDSIELTPDQRRRSQPSIKTKDLVEDPNKFPAEIQARFSEINRTDSSFEYLAGYDTNTSITYLNMTDHLFMFRRTGLTSNENFETFEIVPSVSSSISNVKPIIFKTFNTTLIIYFDEKRVLISSLADCKFLAAIDICKDQSEIEAVNELSQTSKNLEIILMDTIGNVQLLEIKANLTYTLISLEKPSGAIRNLFDSMFSKSEPSNKIRNSILTYKDKKTVTVIKFFENKVYETTYDNKWKLETKKRSRNLNEHIRQWDLVYLNRNKLAHTDTKIVDYIPISFDKFETIFICIYNIYVINQDSTELIITKARTIKYTQSQFESLADIVIREQRGIMGDIIHIKGYINNNDIYIAYNFFDSDNRQNYNTIYTTDRFFRNLSRKDYDQRIFGCGFTINNEIIMDTGFFVILENKLAYIEEEVQRTHRKSQFVEHSDLKIDFDSHKNKRVNSSQRRSSMAAEVNFGKRFEHLFSLFLNKTFDMEYDEELEWIRESLKEQDYTNEVKQFMYHIVNEKNRNLILAIRLIKEDLSIVEERKKELGHFDDIITIELRKKLKKLEKLDELFHILHLEYQYGSLYSENAAMRDAVNTALAIRASQRNYWSNEEICNFFDRVFNILTIKYRIDTSENYDAFYTNLVNIQSFFSTFNDILNSDISQGKDISLINDIIKLGIDIYFNTIQSLSENASNDKRSINGYMSVLIREDNNLLEYIVSFINVLLSNDYLDKIKQDYYQKMSELVEKTILYIYSVKRYLFIGSLDQLIDNLFDCLLLIGHEKQTLDLALK